MMQSAKTKHTGFFISSGKLETSSSPVLPPQKKKDPVAKADLGKQTIIKSNQNAVDVNNIGEHFKTIYRSLNGMQLNCLYFNIKFVRIH